MANIKSQIKRNRQNERRRERNVAVRSRLKTEAKKVARAAEAGDSEAAATQARLTARLLDKAASKGVIHRNTAARRKAGLARRAQGS
ncbi:MAG TPA: 30S ribosomal protein S20 [Actinomycetota bacterium]|nr:30S ribosomal protein S20 [Actinomycetota bacterium]